MNILMVEDDPILGGGLKVNLELNGYKVFWAKNLKAAFELNQHENLHLILLDLGLPDGSGLDLCKKIRSQGSRIPILILTAQADEESVVMGLSLGANDYIKKPFSNRELLARIKNALREPLSRDDQIRLGDLLILIDQRKIMFGSEEIQFNRREFDLLKHMAERAGMVITRESIISNFSNGEELLDRTIDSHISHIRSKLKKANVQKVKLKSEYGVGYRLVISD